MRGKVLLILAANLLAVLLITAAMLAVALLERGNALAAEHRRVFGRVAEALLQVAEAPQELELLLPETPLVSAWFLADGSESIVACSRRGLRGRSVADALAAGFQAGAPVPMFWRGRALRLFVVSAFWRYFPADAGILAATVVLAVLLVLLPVYAFMSRLIVGPVRALAAASRLLRAGGEPAAVAGHTRADEMGSLIRSFNDMAREVISYRRELEKRVEEATRSRLATEESLIRAQRISATSRLAAGIAHEINNPLSGLINAVRALSEGDLDAKKRQEYLALARDGLERIRSVTERMLYFQKGRRIAAVDLRNVVAEALSLAAPRTKGIAVTPELPPQPLALEADASELVQVLLNLLMNAADALGATADPRISVRLERRGDHAVLEVADNGSGMNQETQRHAFDLFYSGKPGGTGLGLAISHTIVENHGGRMELESAPGQGALLRVLLPLSRPRKEER